MNKDKLLNIIKYFGLNTQQRKLMEEVFELQEAIIRAENEYEPIQDIDHITEELADCLILLFQFKEYYQIDGYSILRELNKKIDRTLKRIESGYYK